MPLSEQVYCVADAFKMTERVEQQTIKFCINLKLFGMIQKAAATGNW